MPIVFIPFDQFSPGGAIGTNFGEGWGEVSNAFHTGAAWEVWRGVKNTGAGVAFGPTTGAYPHTWMSGASSSTAYAPDAVTLFAGSKTRLHTVDSAGAFTDVSRAANYGAANEPAGWRFASVGNDVWATNWLDPMQRRVDNTGLFTDGVTSTFKPIPRFLATIKEHMVVANLANAGRFQDEVAWSDADNVLNFDPATGTSTSLAGNKRLVSVPGQITGLVGGEFGVVFKRSATYVLQYAGSPAIFQPALLSPHIGCTHPASIINSRLGLFFFGGDGFYSIQGLAEPVKISPPEIDAWFVTANLFSKASPYRAVDEDTNMIGVACPLFPVVAWLYGIAPVSGGIMNKWLIYNTVSMKWSTAETVGPLSAMVTSVPSATHSLTNKLEGIVCFSWDGATSKYAPISPDLTDCQALRAQTKWRPLSLDQLGRAQQVRVSRVTPVFTTDAATSGALDLAVTVETILEPAAQYSSTLEGPRLNATRDYWGAYPFQSAGRFLRVTVETLGSQWFQDFSGIWIDAEALR